jgi:hypothetical protein
MVFFLSSFLLSFQRDSSFDDRWKYNVYNVLVNEVLDLIAEDSSEDEEQTSALNDVPKKRGGRRNFGPESSKNSYFYSKYIVKADYCMKKNLRWA